MRSTIMNRGLSRIRYLGMTSALAIALVAGAGGVVAASAAEDASLKQQVSRSWNEIKDYSADRKDAAVEKSQELLNELDARLEKTAAEAKAASMDAKAESKEKWQMSMAKLRELRHAAAARLDDLKESGADAWDDAKHDFGTAVEALGSQIEDAGKEIKP